MTRHARPWPVVDALLDSVVSSRLSLLEDPLADEVGVVYASTPVSREQAAPAGRASTDRSQLDRADAVDISVVMPCLNEQRSVGICVAKALEGIRRTGLSGEVVVVDNGSTDDSVAVAVAAGARVVHQSRRGYGNAYRKGFESARGRFLVMGDSDDTYDFSQLDRLVTPLLDGRHDYVLGSRFAGKILPGAMPWSHRYVGNPVLTGLLNRFFKLRSSDAHSGMRAFTRESYRRMNLRCEGMEFASEIVINAARAGLRVTEVPITYHPRTGESKLHSFRDGWRHLRFMLLQAPRYLFVLPGVVMLLLGVAGQAALLPGTLDVGFHRLDVHFSVLFALLAILGYQVVLLGLFAHVYGRSHGFPHRDRWPLAWAERHFSLERGLVTGGLLFVAGFVIDVVVLVDWISRSLGPLNAMRPALFAMTLMVIGVQTAFASFFLSLLRSDAPGRLDIGQESRADGP